MATNRFSARLLRNLPAKVMSFVAALLLLLLHDATRLEERFVNVPLTIEVDEGLITSDRAPTQVRLRLRGEPDEVFAILEQDLRATVDLRRVREVGEYRAAVEIERVGAAAATTVLEVQSDPDTVTVPLERKLVRALEVQPVTSGFLPVGFELEDLISAPSIVEVEGAESSVSALTAIVTEEIDLTGRRDSFTERVRLVRPDSLVRFRGGDVIEVRGVVAERLVLHSFDRVQVLVNGLSPDLLLSGSLPIGTVRVQTSEARLATVDPTEVRLEVDASGILTPGRVLLPARAVVPTDFVVLQFDPRAVQLDIRVAR